MNVNTLTRAQLRVLLDVANDLAYNEVERRVRLALSKHKGWGFCMAMGSATFFPLNRKGNHETSLKWMQPTIDFIDEFNDELKLTGQPMKIEGADAPLQKDWGTYK